MDKFMLSDDDGDEITIIGAIGEKVTIGITEYISRGQMSASVILTPKQVESIIEALTHVAREKS